jgi:hypothetical protein
MGNIKWKAIDYDISNLKITSDSNRLELQPPFQRRSVWGKSAQIMLMDTILKNIPMPKIFISKTIKGDTPYLSVIDGQQRITAILSFMRDEFSLESPYIGEYQGCKFSELPDNTRGEFVGYMLNFNEIIGASDEQLREVYSRVNRYVFALNKQEMRRSDFPGDFLNLSNKLAGTPFFDKAKVFTIANRRRFGDVEYVSELLAGLIGGIQDKKNTLDDFYKDYADWNITEKDKIEKEFIEILKDIHLIFNEKEHTGQSGPITACYHEKLKFKGFIGKTRFKQKADFYALFFAISKLKRLGHNIGNKNLENLRTDLLFMDKYTDPHSNIDLFREYATRCLSDANSKASREWRVNFLFNILSGTYVSNVSVESNEQLSNIAIDWIEVIQSRDINLSSMGAYGCPSYFHCGKCESEDNLSYEDENGELYLYKSKLYWDDQESNYQLTNSKFICGNCLEKDAQ